MTRLELSESGVLIHPTAYDLKGVGGVSLVVAAGSQRAPDANGRVEKYTCVDESDPVDIPNSMVDWFVQDIKDFQRAKGKEKVKKLSERTAKATLKSIAQEDIYDYLRYRAHGFAGMGLIGEGLENALTYLARTDCDKGEIFTASKSGQDLIHKIASANWDRGIATWFYMTKDEKSEVGEGGNIMIHRTATKHGVMESVIKEFPDKISTVDAYDRLEKGLKDEDYTFDPIKDRGMVHAARKATGFAVQGHRWWVRVTEVPENPVMPLVKPEVSA
jgi:hypothetical protein